MEKLVALCRCQFSGPENVQGDIPCFYFSGECRTGSITGAEFGKLTSSKIVSSVTILNLLYTSECQTELVAVFFMCVMVKGLLNLMCRGKVILP